MVEEEGDGIYFAWRRAQPSAVVTTVVVCTALGGTPYVATKRARGVPKWVRRVHANAGMGTFGGAPYGATGRVRGVPKWA
eukprot:7328674-Pyramimonas_sp.AAC.1